jgi:ABC-type multidrug transport system permease subunit
MWKTVLYATRCLKQTFRNSGRVGVIFIVPIVFIMGMAFLYGDESSFVIIGETSDVYTIGVINQDDPIQLNADEINQFQTYIEYSDLLGDPLNDGFGSSFLLNINHSTRLLAESGDRRFDVISYASIDTASKAVQSRFITLCIILPNNFTKTMLSGLNHRINVTDDQMVLNNSEYYSSESIIELIGDYSYARFSEAMILFEEMLNSYTAHYWVTGLPSSGKISTSYDSIATLNFNEFEIFAPALVVFVLITSSTGVASIVGYEKEQGTIDRLKMSGFPVRSFFGGIVLSQVITTILTMVVVIFSLLLLDYPVQSEYQGIYIIIISIFAVLPLIGISLGIASVADGQMATYLPGLLAIPMAFLTGNFIPLPRIEILGEVQLWHINPFFSVGNALRKIMIHNLSPSQFFIDIALLVVIGMGFLLVGLIIFFKKAYE